MAKNKKKFARGGQVGIPRDPNIDLYENQILQAKAQANSGSFLTGALDIAGMGAIGFGMGKMAQGIEAGEGTSNGGTNWGQYLMPGVQALGAIPMFAHGGIAGENIEVEGGEVMETPLGELTELEGPSHEQGGIDVNVPAGTEIYSDRVLGADGKTMAQRKKAREKMLAKLQKKLDNNPNDTMLQRTYKRMSEQFQAQDEQDMQEMLQIQEMEGEMQEFALGGRVKQTSLSKQPLGLMDTDNFFDNQGVPNVYTGQVNRKEKSVIPAGSRGLVPINTQGPTANLNFDYFNAPTNTKAPSNPLTLPSVAPTTGFTTGEMLGMFGQAYNTFAPMENTQRMRAGDTVNTNQFKDYGKAGLKKLDESKQFAQQNLDNQKQQIALQGNSARTTNRNTARGINTMRAMDIATNANEQVTLAQVQDRYAQQMQQIMSMEAQALAQQDQVVMKGAQEADIANRQDRAAYFSNMAQDIATKGQGLQAMGRTLNEVKTRGTTQNTLNSMFPDFKYDSATGKITGVEEVIEKYPSVFGLITDGKKRQEVAMGLATNVYTIDQDNQLIKISTGEVVDVTKL